MNECTYECIYKRSVSTYYTFDTETYNSIFCTHNDDGVHIRDENTETHH